jgi:hypothetical protein
MHSFFPKQQERQRPEQKEPQTWNIRPFFLAVVATSERTRGRKQQQQKPSVLIKDNQHQKNQTQRKRKAKHLP